MAKSNILASLEVVATLPEKPQGDRTEMARTNLLATIDLNLEWAAAKLKGQSFVVRKSRFIDKPNADGTGTERVKEAMPLKKWRPLAEQRGKDWFVHLRHGFTKLSLGKGTDVKAGDFKQVPIILTELRKAVAAKELDAALFAAFRSKPKKAKA